MKCSEVKELIGLCLDSELDPRGAQEMRRHLEQCPDCAKLCRAEQALDAALRSKLQPASPTASLWQAEEAFVAKAFPRRDREGVPRADAARAIWSFCRQLLWPNPAYYAGLAVIWLFLLALSPATPGRATQAAAPRQGLSAQSRLVLLEQRRELRELLDSPEPAPQPRPQKTLAPRSERKDDNHEATTEPATPVGWKQEGGLAHMSARSGGSAERRRLGPQECGALPSRRYGPLMPQTPEVRSA
jgi:hypothetical protein